METAQQLAEARKNAAAARQRMEAIRRWGKAKRDAAEDLEFWSNRAAFLANAR